MAKSGLAQKLIEAVGVAAEVGKEVGGKVWDIGQEMGLAKGASELASALYTGSAFVQYGNQGPAKESMADVQAGAQQLEQQAKGKEMEREREMEL